MAVVLLTVSATIAPEREADFNRWYPEHMAELLQFPGAVSARRYKKILGDGKWQYMAVYEFASEEVFARFQESEQFKALIAEYDRRFGEVSVRQRDAYLQVYP